MIDATFIFIMIGVAHWCAHVMNCRACRASLPPVLEFFGEAFINIFGWPIHAIAYIHSALKPTPKRNFDREIDELQKVVDEALANLNQPQANASFFERKKDESMEDFIARATKETITKMEKDNNDEV